MKRQITLQDSVSRKRGLLKTKAGGRERGKYTFWIIFMSEFLIPFISLYMQSSSMQPEIGGIFPNYHPEEKTQPFLECGFRAALKEMTDSFWEGLGVLNMNMIISSSVLLTLSSWTGRRSQLLPFFCWQNRDSVGCWGPAWFCLKGFSVCSLLA